MSNSPDTERSVLSADGHLCEGHEEIQKLLENIPFSDPSVLKPSYQCFGRHVYDELLKHDKKSQEHSASRLEVKKAMLTKDMKLTQDCSSSVTAVASIDSLLADDRFSVEPKLGQSCTLAEPTESSSQKPEGILECKTPDIALVDSSNESSIPCVTAKAETLPKEAPLTDSHWSDFNEDVPLDYPARYEPLGGCIPQAFTEDFTSVLNFSYADYLQWVAKSADVIQNNGQLAGKYHTVAAVQSTHYPTPLSQAECVSLVMAYDLIRTCQSEGGNAMLLDWISLQGESEDSKSICKFAVLTLLGGVCFLAHSVNANGLEPRPDRMFTLLCHAVSTDHLAITHIVLNWQPDIEEYKDEEGWTPLHLAAARNATTLIHTLYDKVAEKEVITKLGNTPLLVAAISGGEEAIAVLLAKKANPNVANTHKWTPVHYAAVANNAQMLKLLHQHGGELQSTTLKENSPLSLAIMNDSEGAAVLLILKNAALVMWRNSYNWTVLHLAASSNGLKMLKLLSGLAEIDLNVVTSKGHTPLAIAVMQKCSQAAEVLLKAKANPDVPNTKGWTALHIAAEKDAYNMVHLLCEVGANTEVQTVMGSTPLCIAAMYGCSDAVAELLRQNANPNARNQHALSANAAKMIGQVSGLELDSKTDKSNSAPLTNEGSTALALTVLTNSVECAKALLLGKADPDMCGDHGWSPLHLAAERNYAEVVELLCSFGANPNVTNQQGYTPLVISVAKDSKEAARALLKNSANPDVQSELNGWSALHFAAQEDNQALGELLCDFNADLNVRTHENNPPLLIAALNGSKSMTSTLLSRKANVNAQDSHGWTTLHCAAQENASEIVFLLCASSADVKARTDKGNTPLAIAAIHNSDVAAEQLIKMGADVNTKNCDDWTPLCCAVYSGSFDSNLIEHLCSPANVSIQTKQHGTPLHLSVLKQNLVYVNCLLKCGADPHIQDNRGDTPLNVALRSKSVDIANAIQEYILKKDPLGNTSMAVHVVFHPEGKRHTAEHCVTQGELSEVIGILHAENSEGINLNAMDRMGNTPLHTAARDGDKNVVEKLLQQKVELANVPGENGYLPIQLAVMGNHIAVVELLSHYCDAKGLTDDKGYTLLHLAAKWNSAQTAKQLLSDGHQPDTRDDCGYCPIHVAALNGSTDVIEVCIDHDIGMLSLQADNGYTIAHCAAEMGQKEVVKLILNNYRDAINLYAMTILGETALQVASLSTAPGAVDVIKLLCKVCAEPTLPDGIKDMTLHFAVLRDDEEKARALLSAHPELVDMVGSSGEVPLHWAVKKSSSKMICILCEANCDVNAGDQYGDTPLHLATGLTYNVDIVQQLLANGAAPEKANCVGITSLDVAAAKDIRNCFVGMHDEAEKAYRFDKVFYHMQRIHGYMLHRQMDKAASLMSKSVSKVQYWKYLEDSTKVASGKLTLVGILKNVVGNVNYEPLFKALLDKCIFGYKVIRRPALFEADTEGNLPGTAGYRTQDGSFFSNLVKNPKMLFAVADHPALQAYVKYRIDQIASPFFWRGLLFYLFQLFLLTFALATAARPDLPLNRGYRDPIDIFRGICEAAILLITVVKIVNEVFEFMRSGRAYLKDWLNYFQWSSIILILLIIPLRVTAHPGQWVVAALAHIIYAAQGFDFVSVSSSIGIYVQTLIIIFWKDIFKFLAAFVVILLLFGSSFYYSLRYDADLANSTIAELVPGDSNYLYDVYLWGLVLMIQAGSTLDFVHTRNTFGPLSFMLYYLFLFLVVTILLNVLIAQVSETYSAVQSTARASLTFHCIRFIARCEENTALWFLLWTFRWKRMCSSFHRQCDLESQIQRDNTHRKCYRCLSWQRCIREEFYCHDDDAMYWPGQLFHKDESDKYLDLTLRAKFWRTWETAVAFLERHLYPRIVAAYEETSAPVESTMEGIRINTEDAAAPNTSSAAHLSQAVEKELQQVQQLRVSHEEAFQVENATMKQLQSQMKEIAERQQATIKQFKQHMEEIVEIQSATMKQLQLQMKLATSSKDCRQTAAEINIERTAQEPEHLQQQGLGWQAQQENHLNITESVGNSGSLLPQTAVPNQ